MRPDAENVDKDDYYYQKYPKMKPWLTYGCLDLWLMQVARLSCAIELLVGGVEDNQTMASHTHLCVKADKKMNTASKLGPEWCVAKPRSITSSIVLCT